MLQLYAIVGKSYVKMALLLVLQITIKIYYLAVSGIYRNGANMGSA